MSKLRFFLKYWLPVALWGSLIFTASGDTKSVARSSRIIEPFLRWLFPDLSDDVIWGVVLVARKCAHLTEFGILALLLWRAFRGTFWQDSDGWSRRCVACAWGGALVFAMCDEWYQTIVPGRQGSLWDVGIDSLGAALGLLAFWLICGWRQGRRHRSNGAALSKP